MAAIALATVAVSAGAGASPPPERHAHRSEAHPTWWRPSTGTGPFLYQLQGVPADAGSGGIAIGQCQRAWGGSACVKPMVYAIDLYIDSSVNGRNDVPNRQAVAAIHASGAFAICYVDAGTWESWRPDAGRFPPSVLGLPNGWPGERWLDIRQLHVLLPIMRARARKCARAGFNAIDWDNVDGYANQTGFPLTAREQLRYDRDLARIAHALGLAAGLKNDYGQVSALAGVFDFAVDEQCFQYQECSALEPFVRLGKPVYDIEYHPGAFCPAARKLGIWASLQATSLLPQPWLPCQAALPAPRPAVG